MIKYNPFVICASLCAQITAAQLAGKVPVATATSPES